MKALRLVDLNDKDFGPVLLAIAPPLVDNPWGVLAPLEGTVWWGLIPVVPGPALSDALHGYAKPLMQHIGPSPRELARKLSAETPTLCVLGHTRQCAFVTPDCVPGPKLPDCYEPQNLIGEAAILATRIACLWREGRYVIRVEGPEHSIR